MLDKNIDVGVSIWAPRWDWSQKGFVRASERLHTGNVGFVAVREDNGEVVYEDRYKVKLPARATKEMYLDQLERLKSWVASCIESTGRFNWGSYKVQNEIGDGQIERILQEINEVYYRWPYLFAVKSNFDRPDEEPVYKGSFILCVYEKSKIGLYPGRIEKRRIRYSAKDFHERFSDYRRFSKHIDELCENWDCCRDVSEEDKRKVWENCSAAFA